MKILVTGAAGMLGSALCPTLMQRGHTVFATDLAPVDEGIECLDVKSYKQIEEIVGKVKRARSTGSLSFHT
jgi:nucleoside-diphosphate-sugar epimerase